ncbi:unnamed protein product, partial [Closterium sp. NIES-53]
MGTRSVHSLTHPPLLPSPPSLLSTSISGRLNIELHGYPKLNVYFVDLFHTLVNMPLKRFSAVLVAAYAALFVTFAIPFLAFARVDGLDCLPGVKRLDHAVWFTVQSSMSIGFGGDLTPHPDCFVVNFFVAVLSVVTLGFAYALLGVFYVKFSRPTRRAGTIKFSQYMVMYEELGQLRLSFRVADFRKHQIISAHVRMLAALNNNILAHEDEAVFKFSQLPVAGGSQIYLGLPCTVTHAVTHGSPLYGLSHSMMERSDLEILVLLEAVDCSTSATLQVRHSYRPCDIKHNYRFVKMVYRAANGRRCV